MLTFLQANIENRLAAITIKCPRLFEVHRCLDASNPNSA